jgi:AraC-like DNA-binding protein
MDDKNLIINQIFHSNYTDIQVFGAGYEKTSSKKPPRALSDLRSFSMHYIMSGVGYLKLEPDGEEIKIEKEHIFILPPNTPLEYRPDKRTPWKYCWIDFIGAKAPEFLKRLNIDPKRPVIKIRDNAAIRKLFLNNVADCQKYCNFSDVVATASFYLILTQLFKQQKFTSEAAHDRSDTINSALRYINNHYADTNINIKIVAAHAGVRDIYLSRLFRKKSNITFTDYLIRVRLAAAVALMEKGERSVSAVAYAVGFQDPYYFSNVFKKYNTVSPREHMKRLDGKSHPVP